MSTVTSRWASICFVTTIAVLRLLLLPQLELSPDESYYSLWAEHLDWGYYSKGPGVAVAIWLGTNWLGSDELGLRFFSPILGLCTSLVIWILAKRMFDEAVAFWAVLTGVCLPIFWVGSLVMTIDPLSVFFWSAALLTLWFAVERGARLNGWWFLSGILIGLGFLCKYTNAFQLLSVVLLLACSRKLRIELARGLPMMLVGFAAVAWPPLVWNANHNWITLSHLKERGGLDEGFGFHPGELIQFAGLHLGVYSPLIFGGIVIATVAACLNARRDPKKQFLLAFGLPLIGFYAILSLKDCGEANWTAPGFISLILLAAAFWIEQARKSFVLASTCCAGLSLGMLMSLSVLNTDILREFGVPWTYQRDPSGRLRGWATAAETVNQFRDAFEQEAGDSVFLIANRYQTAAELGYYLPNKRLEGPLHPPVYIPESQAIENQFSFWPRYDEFMELAKDAPPPDPMFIKERNGINAFEGRNALFITDNTEGIPPSPIVRGFQKVELAGEFDVFRRGLFVKRWRVFLCWNYQTLPL